MENNPKRSACHGDEERCSLSLRERVRVEKWRERGTLAPGKLADWVMLDRDIFGIDLSEIEKARVVLTMIGERIVHEAR